MLNQTTVQNNFHQNIVCFGLMVALLIVIGAYSQIAMADTRQDQNTAQKMLHVLDYVSVDYANVVQNGVVLNKDEYQEQMEFSTRLIEQAKLLPDSEGKSTLQEQAQQLHNAIRKKQDGEHVASLCNTMSLSLIEKYNVTVVPRTAPSLQGAAQLFQENCSACHGTQGFGDGPNAAGLQPAPANFHDHERQQYRSVFSLYNTISLGVAGTAMPAFDSLSNEQRWQLAFFVSNFFANDAERAKGEAILADTQSRPAINSLRQLTQTTPAQIAADYGEQAVAELAYLRANPTELQSQTTGPLDVARDKLNASLAAYEKGNSKLAYDLAVAAYLEGFELVETPLDSADPELRQHIEKSMLHYREMIKNNASMDELQQASKDITALLANAGERLRANHVSSTVNFLSALLILLREGIEAILILAAISAVLIKTGRNEALRYLHFGWIAALALGGLTWYVADQFITISGAHRELTEGITALIAAAMLIYVGFWLHKQTNAMKWQHFIRAKLSQSLTGSAVFGLALVAFVAVYREVFESILFFQTLWLQAGSEGQGQIVSGMLSAVVLLVIIAWGVFKFSVRLPLKLFFQVNAVFLYVLAIVFTGKGIAALQEAGKLPINSVQFFRIDALGIYPNAESLGTQAVLIAIALSLFLYSRYGLNRGQPHNQA